jgi:16S rRNA (cytosine1402-N4)-methyltransferase
LNGRFSDQQHLPVLLEESVHALVADPNGIYVDGTFGRGGHSRAILARLSDTGRLIAFDRDPEAVSAGRILAEADRRFSILQGRFGSIGSLQGRVGGGMVHFYCIQGNRFWGEVNSEKFDWL